MEAVLAKGAVLFKIYCNVTIKEIIEYKWEGPVKLKIVIVSILLWQGGWAKEKNCVHDEKNFRCVKYIYNYDADTITFDIPGVHPLLGKRAKIRVFGIDTPELKTKDACEKKKAIYAKKLVQQKLKKASTIHLTDLSRGKYFRIVANVIVDGQSLGEFLLQKGLAQEYYGGQKPQQNWCASLDQSPSEAQSN